MKQTLKRMLALVMALMLALPTFALADQDEANVPLPEETVDEVEITLGDDPDAVGFTTGNRDGEGGEQPGADFGGA